MSAAVLLKHFYDKQLVVRYRELVERKDEAVLALSLDALREVLLVYRLVWHVLLNRFL